MPNRTYTLTFPGYVGADVGTNTEFTLQVGTSGRDGPNLISDATALGALAENASPPFLLASDATGTQARKLTPGSKGLSLLLASNTAAALALLGTGTPSASTFLRGDGAWQAVPMTPGGTAGQVQWNSGGSFAGAVALTYAASGTHLLIAAQGTGVTPLDVQRASGQTAAMHRYLDSNGSTVLSSVGSAGEVLVPAGSGSLRGLGIQGDPTTGFSIESNEYRWYKTGTLLWVLGTTRCQFQVPLRVSLTASASTPGLTDSGGDSDTGLYRPADNYLGIAGGGLEVARFGSSGGTRQIGVLGAAAAARQTVTGSRGGNAALASLLTAMATFGWVTDSSTA